MTRIEKLISETNQCCRVEADALREFARNLVRPLWEKFRATHRGDKSPQCEMCVVLDEFAPLFTVAPPAPTRGRPTASPTPEEPDAVHVAILAASAPNGEVYRMIQRRGMSSDREESWTAMRIEWARALMGKR